MYKMGFMICLHFATMKSVVVPQNKTRVSSVLNKDVKQFGKTFLFDGNEETCWNSDQGSPQWILLEFETVCNISEIQIKFQGGFVGKQCHVEVSSGDQSSLTNITKFYPEDINALQTFPVKTEEPVRHLKIVFNDSTDFFGRITIYTLDIIGDFIS